MAWIDNQGRKKETIIEHDLGKIDVFVLQCYYFSFGTMNEFDTASILFKYERV